MGHDGFLSQAGNEHLGPVVPVFAEGDVLWVCSVLDVGVELGGTWGGEGVGYVVCRLRVAVPVGEEAVVQDVFLQYGLFASATTMSIIGCDLPTIFFTGALAADLTRQCELVVFQKA